MCQLKTAIMDFNKYAEKGNLMLDELASELGIPGDRDLAFRIMRSALHTLRDRLPIQESLHLVSELPFVIKALYVDGWKYQGKPDRQINSVRDFVRRMIQEDYPAGHHDIFTAKDGENAARAVMKVVQQHLSSGESADILNALPDGLKELWQVQTA